MMLETVLEGTADEIGSAYCLLCETMEYPEDRSWVIFNLRDDARFSDGTPMTAEDVLFSYQTFLEKGLTDFRTIMATRSKGRGAGPLSVKFTFKPGIPYRDLPPIWARCRIMSKAHYEANNLDLAESSLTPFMGSGPYVLDKMRGGPVADL